MEDRQDISMLVVASLDREFELVFGGSRSTTTTTNTIHSQYSKAIAFY
ncbi:hypothetical protein PPL_04300 [Heterostelium album PN500]|uniref:Uncharacterized protein n=1 Tax=Heterostelium pallidum (strain ATCC 26659 / Pp 5 / PN500) TaxID=670386 RepID=D3B765_HETP5|nr:hypothetical protein PPL_04300 [Heterostelium album PN500]EFA82608.1 hypothetical protein PPL_04300 [Heterostelium album PN500]|eukprot:XP_020434725.1 hypothetical protein PPL_04300 [Heterostelium album PN500]